MQHCYIPSLHVVDLKRAPNFGEAQGVEIIAVTAGEAENPEVTIPRAMRSIVWRLILFYVLAIAVMVAMVPWNQTAGSSTLSGSPFVTAFASAHVPFAASIMNFVVLTAALSSMNTNLYLSTRMLFSLGRGGYAPEWLGKVSRNGVPRRALLASTAGIVAAILLAIFAPRNAFLMLYGVAVAGMLFVLARDPQYASSFSPCHHERAAIESAHAFMGPPAFYDCRHSVARCDLDYNLFRRWTAVVGTGIFGFPLRYFPVL
jgi:Amino acid permease